MASSPYEVHRTSTHGCDVRCLVAGEGPEVVAVHGGGGLRWTPWHQLMTQRVRLHAIELPGFGESTLSEELKSIYDLADIVADVIESEGLQRPGLVAESIGGFTSSWMAIRHPDAIDRLVLESPGGFRLPGVKPRAEMSHDEVRQALYRHPERVPSGFGDPANQPRGFMQHLTDRSGWDDQLKARLPEIRVPTLIVNGEFDGIVAPDSGRIFREHIPTAWRVCMDDAAHVLHLDQPELFAAITLGFLLGDVHLD